ncbi:MAG: hypothetical protein ABIJ59_01305 [Pseudomonadota bacterium]
MKTQKLRTQKKFYGSLITIKDKIIFFLTSLLLILVLSSCGMPSIGRYNPDPSIAKGVVKDIAFSNTITIINDQPDSKDHTLRFGETIVNYNAFTQSIVDALKMELTRNGITINDSSQKKLYVKVTNVDYQLRAPNYRAYIDTEVKTGNDHIEFIEVTRGSYSSPLNMSTAPTRPMDAAFEDIVRDIMNNKKIQDYLMDQDG